MEDVDTRAKMLQRPHGKRSMSYIVSALPARRQESSTQAQAQGNGQLQVSKVNNLRRGETHIVQPGGVEATDGASADKGNVNGPSDSRYLHGLARYSTRGASHECNGECNILSARRL